MMFKKYKFTFPYCELYFESQNALLLHENKYARHNQNLTYRNNLLVVIKDTQSHINPVKTSRAIKRKNSGGLIMLMQLF